MSSRARREREVTNIAEVFEGSRFILYPVPLKYARAFRNNPDSCTDLIKPARSEVFGYEKRAYPRKG
jgi:hypothetical protein